MARAPTTEDGREWIPLRGVLLELFPFVRAKDVHSDGILGRVKRKRFCGVMTEFVHPDEVERARFWVRAEYDLFGPEAWCRYD
jgi:hypothetical protein